MSKHFFLKVKLLQYTVSSFDIIYSLNQGNDDYKISVSYFRHSVLFVSCRAQQLSHHGSSFSQQQSTGSGLHSAEDTAAICPLLQPGQSLRA